MSHTATTKQQRDQGFGVGSKSSVSDAVESKQWFCPDVFTEVCVGSQKTYHYCCNSKGLHQKTNELGVLDWVNHQDMVFARKQMLAGNKEFFSHSCSTCINRESMGLGSRRLKRIQKMQKEGWTHKVQEIVDNNFINKTYIDRIDLKIIGNLCNFRCVMCSAKDSSEIAKENGLPIVSSILKDPDSRDSFFSDLQHLLKITKKINITGGEPFINPYFLLIVGELLKMDFHPDFEFQVTTNLSKTHIMGKDLLDLLAKLPKVRLRISIDNLGDRGEYMRTNKLFSEFSTNLRRVMEFKAFDCVSLTVLSALNLGDYSSILEFLDSEGITKNYSVACIEPSALEPWNLPIELRNFYLTRQTHPMAIQRCKEYLDRPFSAQSFEQLKTFLNQKDKTRKPTSRDLWPEIWDYT